MTLELPVESTDHRNLPAVTDNVTEPTAYSMTFLQHVDNCPRAGYLYRKHRSGPTSHPLDRGTAFHLFAAEATQLLIDADEPVMEPDVAKGIANGVIAEHPELIVPHAEADDVRIMAFHWAKGTYFPVKHIAGIEKQLTLELAGVKVRGVVDLILLYPEAGHASVIDYKTSFNVPNQRAFERSFQTRFYALMLLFGKGDDDPVGIGAGVRTVDLIQLYPRYLRGEGLTERKVTISRDELVDFRHDVEAVIARAKRGFEQGLWPAVTSSHCDICPARHECPLPPILIPGAAQVEADPQAAAERRFHLAALSKKAQADLRGYAKENGPIYYGPVEPGKPGRVFGPVLEEKEEIIKPKGAKSSDVIAAAVNEALEEGRPVDVKALFKESTSTRFTDRKHEPDEVEDGHE